MTIRRLEKPEWRPFFDTMSRILEAKVAEVEVASLDLGDRTQAEWLPLIGITYDPRDDAVEIALDGLDHMIRKPRESTWTTAPLDCRALRSWMPMASGRS